MYQKYWREIYTYNDATFGATSVTHNIQGPLGCVGFVRDIMVDVATSLVGTTTVPEIDVGLSSGDYTFGRFRLGSNASTGLGTGVARAGQTAGLTGNPPRALSDFAGHVILDGGPLTSQGVAGGSWSTQVPAGRIPANQKVVITNAAGSGTPAGGGTVTVVIDWVGEPWR